MKLSEFIEERAGNSKVTGASAFEWEDKHIKKFDPKFYKTKTTKRKKTHDKNGLPIEPYAWLPRSA